MSESEIVNVALNEFFKVKMLKEDVDDITEILEFLISLFYEF